MTSTDAQRLLPAADDSLIQASCSLSIRKARTTIRTHLLLKLIDETHSVSGACRLDVAVADPRLADDQRPARPTLGW